MTTDIKRVFRNDGSTFPEEIQKFFTAESLRQVQSEGCRFRQEYGGFSTMYFEGNNYFVHKFDEEAFVKFFMEVKVKVEQAFVKFFMEVKAKVEQEEQKKFQWEAVSMQLAKIPRSKEQVLLALNNPKKFQGFTFSFVIPGDSSQYQVEIVGSKIQVYGVAHRSVAHVCYSNLAACLENFNDRWIIDEPTEG